MSSNNYVTLWMEMNLKKAQKCSFFTIPVPCVLHLLFLRFENAVIYLPVSWMGRSWAFLMERELKTCTHLFDKTKQRPSSSPSWQSETTNPQRALVRLKLSDYNCPLRHRNCRPPGFRGGTNVPWRFLEQKKFVEIRWTHRNHFADPKDGRSWGRAECNIRTELQF